MSVATLTQKGQITIPKIIRDSLGLHTGDLVDFHMEEKGGVRLIPVSRRVDEVFGCLASPGKSPVSVDEMKRQVAGAFRGGRL